MCADFLRRDAFSAEGVAGFKQSFPISQSHREIGMRVDFEVNSNHRIDCRCIGQKQLEACDSGYRGAEEGDDVSD